MVDMPPQKKQVVEGNFLDDDEEILLGTPNDVFVQGFREASRWYRNHENISAKDFPKNPQKVASELLEHDISFSNLVGMVLNDCAHHLISDEFDAYSFSKFALYAKITYEKMTYLAYPLTYLLS